MQPAKRRGTKWAIAVSIIAHTALAVVVATQRPMLRIPYEEAGPPQPIIPILLMPRIPAAMAGPEHPGEIRLHRRKQRFVLDVATPPPVVIAQPPAARGNVAAGPSHPSPLPEGPKAGLRTVLRQGMLGCANALAVNLTRAERDLCDEQLGRGARDAPFIDPGFALSREKRALLDQAAASRAASKTAAERPLGAGLSRPFVKPSDYDGEPYITGAGASALGQATYPPARRTAPNLGPLRP